MGRPGCLIVIFKENGHSDRSSNSWQSCLHFAFKEDMNLSLLFADIDSQKGRLCFFAFLGRQVKLYFSIVFCLLTTLHSRRRMSSNFLSSKVSQVFRQCLKLFCFFFKFFNIASSFFHQWSGRPGFNPRSRHTKDFLNGTWYPPCLTLGNIRYVSRAKWSNLGKGVAPSPTPWCSSYWKGSLLTTLDYGRQQLLTS